MAEFCNLEYENKSQKIYNMNETEIQEKLNNTISEIADNFYKIKPLNKKITKSLSENFYKNKNNVLQLNTNFEDIEEFEYEIDEFLYYFQIVKEKIAKVRLMKTILLEKTINKQ
jgi:hypothetical protein